MRSPTAHTPPAILTCGQAPAPGARDGAADFLRVQEASRTDGQAAA